MPRKAKESSATFKRTRDGFRIVMRGQLANDFFRCLLKHAEPPPGAAPAAPVAPATPE